MMNENQNTDGLFEYINSPDMEDAIIEKAQQETPDAWNLAIQTQDEELFAKVWDNALRLVLDDILTGLIEKGLVETAGMTEDGDMTYMLSPAGRRLAEEL